MNLIIYFISILSFFSIINNDKIRVNLDKESYQVDDFVNITLKSKKAFQLATNGDCNSSILQPSLIKMNEDGTWPEVEAMKQMCCGLPYSQAMKEAMFTVQVQQKGTYKIAIFLYGSIVETDSFVVE